MRNKEPWYVVDMDGLNIFSSLDGNQWFELPWPPRQSYAVYKREALVLCDLLNEIEMEIAND